MRTDASRPRGLRRAGGSRDGIELSRRPARPGLLGPVLTALAVLLASCGGSERAGSEAAPTSISRPELAAVDVHGHRGARGLRPENTLPAFETALDLAVDALELDLHLTADGVVVVWHDPIIDPSKCRLAENAPAGSADPDDPTTLEGDLAIASMTLEELGSFRCDRNPEPADFPHQTADPTPLAGDDYRIVSLAELFDFVDRYAASDDKSTEQRSAAAKVSFNIETKRRPDDPSTIGDDFDGRTAGLLEREIVRLVREASLIERVIVQSFDHRSLWAVHEVEPRLRLAALTRRGAIEFRDVAQAGATIWSPNHQGLDAAAVDEAHGVGLEVVPWTVNDPQVMEGLVDWGVDGIITDRPDLLVPVARPEVE